MVFDRNGCLPGSEGPMKDVIVIGFDFENLASDASIVTILFFNLY